MTVADEFSSFYEACKIPAEKITSISDRYKRITRQLNQDFWTTDSAVSHSLYTGSYGRDTAVRGISDLDMGFVLPNSVYDRFNRYSVKGQSSLLQEVKQSIQHTYNTSNSFGDGQVVVVHFTDNIRFEVLPVFQKRDGSGWIYPDTNNGGEWKFCNPRAEIKAIADRHADTNGNLKRICRMTRVWRDFCEVPLSGMLIDTLCYQFLERYGNRDKSLLYYDYIFRDLFDFISQQNLSQNYWLAPGSWSYVRRTGTFEHKARSAHLRAVEAIAYDQNQNHWSRRQKWREVFGPSFPG